MTFEEIETLAQKVLDGKSDSYVSAAYILARVVLRDLKLAEAIRRDHDLMFDNLSSTQTRCTELLEENRRLRALIGNIPADKLVRQFALEPQAYDD